ncbi:unnamed protein product [Phytophthora fragariaefolia]|uniref:Unnamed protein product n=1 Tax=Phytophthora fragariaefolia TaxID=1490495 RepID=A0A9W6XB12_9STRA|nr:unnamed protein product [Phytophthora fragariaefolia]
MVELLKSEVLGRRRVHAFRREQSEKLGGEKIAHPSGTWILQDKTWTVSVTPVIHGAILVLEYALQQGYEPKVTLPPRAQVSKATTAEMSSSSDSDDGGKSKRKGFKIGSSGTPVRWDGEDWTCYKHAMLNAFEKSLLDGIATGRETEDASWDEEKKGEFNKKQAKFKILIQGSLSMRLAKQVMTKPTGTEMWRELMDIYEGKSNPAMTAQSVSLTMRATQDKSASSNMGKYTPDLVRELILTAELRSKDWENNAFGNKQTSKTQVKQSGVQRSNKRNAASMDKKPNKSGGSGCFHCGGTDHYKRDCPVLEEKSSGRTAQAKYARNTPKSKSLQSTNEGEEHAGQRDVVIGEAVKRDLKYYDPTRWYFDTGTNAHITACKEYFTILQSMEDNDWNPTISGFADGVGAKAEGFGTIMLAAMIDEETVFLLVEDVLYVPSAGCNLLSPGLALDQGFTMTWDSEARIFGMTKENIEVIRTKLENRLWTINAQNVGNNFANNKNIAMKKKVFANFAVTDGVEDIDVWHERLGHTCPEYIRLMVDRGMAKGIMLKRRGKIDCVDCHFGKQRRKTFRKKPDRPIEKVNDLVFAGLLIPGASNGSPYTAVLVVMDGYSRYVKIYLLKSKGEVEVNKYMQEYIACAERQHGVNVAEVITRNWSNDGEDGTGGVLVKQVLTDKGQEFCNGSMEKWYRTKGITHTKVGPNASQLNPVERTHQTLIGMVKTMMHQSGLPSSFWPDALETAVYVKNRVFCKGSGSTPYELMFGSKPDLHHIRAFGSLAFCHTPTSKRKKLAMNCRIGFLLGYREDVVGCHVYFPTEHKKGFVSDVEINEAIKYKDRVERGYRIKVNRWLQTFNEFIEEGEIDDFENGDDDNLANSDDDDSSQQVNCDVDSKCVEVTDVEMENGESVGESNDYNPTNAWQGRLRSRPPQSRVPGNSLQNGQSEHENSQSENSADRQLWDEILRNSSLPDYDAFEETQEGENARNVAEPDINLIAESNKIENVDASVSSVDAVSIDHIGDDDDQSDQSGHSEQNDNDDDIESEIAPSMAHVTELDTVVDADSSVSINYDSLFDPADEREASEERTGELVPVTNHEVVIVPEQIIGHRRPRDVDVRRTRERKRNKVDVKRVKETPSRRPGLRERDERRPPQRYDDYVVYSAFRAMYTDRRGDGGIRATDVKIPRTRREAFRSKYGPLWQADMDKQVAALRAKGVLKMIPKSELPEGQRLLKTMWVYDLKTDHLGYVVEFRARIVGRGDKQRPGLDYTETFSPVARMATFRMFVAVCTLLQLPIYQGDINTAYLNAVLTIKQYLEDLDGYPCELDGMAYMINKALYGLKQSGREWNTEVNAWFINYGFKQCNTEPCLYYYDRDGEFVIDQDLLDTYLGIEVEQNSTSIKVHQTKYCEQILERFGFSEAHPSRIPMETKLRLTVNDTDTAARKQEPRNGAVFPYRELVGSLMYLATCTRPDLAYAVGQLSRYVQNPTQQHIGAAKRLLRYLVGTKTQGIVYSRDQATQDPDTLVIDGYCDSDWGNDPDTRKSVTGYVHCIAGGAISWASRRQSIVAQSTAEAEYVAACEACMKGQGLRNVLIEVFSMMKTENRLGIDNQAAFVMATNPTYNRRTRHIELRWHYLRDQVVKKTVELRKVKTDVNPSDLMTKPLASDRFEMLNDMIGMTKEHIPK